MQQWLKAEGIGDVRNFYEGKYLKDGEDAFRKTDWNFFFRIAAIFFRDFRPTDSILDCGSGGGHFLKSIVIRFAMSHPYLCGIELSPAAVKVAGTNLQGNAHFIEGNYIQASFPENSFDIVTCWGSIEHAPDLKEAFYRLAWYAKPGGLIMLNVPLEFEGCLDGIKAEPNQKNNERFAIESEWLKFFGEFLIPLHHEIVDGDLVMVFR